MGRLIFSVRECLLETARRRMTKKNLYDVLNRDAELLGGTTLETIITTIWEASDQAIKRDSAIGIANKAMTTGVAATLGEFERVVGIATKWAYCIGLDVEQCVDIFVTAAARLSPKLAANELGLVVGDRALTLAGLTATERTQMFLDDMISATGWDWARIVVTAGVEA